MAGFSDTILLLEGLNDIDMEGGCVFTPPTTGQERSTKKMAGTKGQSCTRYKYVYDKYGNRVQRCANFSGTSGNLGASKKRKRKPRKQSTLFGFGQNEEGSMLEKLKPTLMTGALAAAGAWVSRSLGGKVGTMVNVQPGSMTSNLLTAAVGVALGTVVGKVLKKPEIGMALGVGAVAISALNLIGTVTPQQTAGMGVLTAEAAPYYQAAATPPVASFPSVSNLYTDAGAPVLV